MYPDLVKSQKIPVNNQYIHQIPPGILSATFAYGYAYSFSEVMTHADTSFAMIFTLIASDTPRQID